MRLHIHIKTVNSLFFSGGEAAESLLERARCYALLGQRKTAIFDFSAILKEHPKHVHALCGRGFTYLMLNQQKVFFFPLVLSIIETRYYCPFCSGGYS